MDKNMAYNMDERRITTTIQEENEYKCWVKKLLISIVVS